MKWIRYYDECLCIGCSNLPVCEGGKPPTTQVSVSSYAHPSDRHRLATLFKSEVIEVCIVCNMHDMVLVMVMWAISVI